MPFFSPFIFFRVGVSESEDSNGDNGHLCHFSVSDCARSNRSDSPRRSVGDNVSVILFRVGVERTLSTLPHLQTESSSSVLVERVVGRGNDSLAAVPAPHTVVVRSSGVVQLARRGILRVNHASVHVRVEAASHANDLAKLSLRVGDHHVENVSQHHVLAGDKLLGRLVRGHTHATEGAVRENVVGNKHILLLAHNGFAVCE